MRYLTHSESETEQLGQSLAAQLHSGSVVAFTGDLGAGKTAFTRGLARGLGYTGRVTSPTFTIVNEYRGSLPLFHFDLYRLPDSDSLYDIGWDDYLRGGGVCAVEWSENAAEALPPDTVFVSIRRGEGECERIITVTGGTAF
ncbi:MAG: tRNA (adenosine(37)-N6)-threonylcarbamoyltransferase complex ATPase subunit type 1 TsaE [Oscillospiraceae bacterium]|nr:tRNA (adenosine(37)-N6)-threonylcarbamoyltransferase complex ATPase subunit type 1 TsaE [Oscillospiraceae bacterium]